jgi:tRNA C32,U32 (ribose-2'-O)-methylase TrmJ
MEFSEISDALYYMNTHGLVISAELSEKSIPLTDIHRLIPPSEGGWRSQGGKHLDGDLFVIVGNEVTGVESETLEKSDIITHIPMLGIKESLNVGQAAAIIMWELL